MNELLFIKTQSLTRKYKFGIDFSDFKMRNGLMLQICRYPLIFFIPLCLMLTITVVQMPTRSVSSSNDFREHREITWTGIEFYDVLQIRKLSTVDGQNSSQIKHRLAQPVISKTKSGQKNSSNDNKKAKLDPKIEEAKSETQKLEKSKSARQESNKSTATIADWKVKRGVLYNTTDPFPGVCNRRNTTEEFCNKVYTTPGNSTKNYDIHIVSGCPGSGNDWILWLGSVIGYEKDQQNLLNHCEIAGARQWKWKQPNGSWGSQCPYLKTHEPYFHPAPWHMTYGTKAAIIFRHPFDAAYSEYKRKLVLRYLRGQKVKWEDSVKNSIDGVKESDFFAQNHTILNGSKWTEHALYSMDKWVEHATFWIKQWDKPLIPLIYNDFKTNTATQLPHLLKYFNFTPDIYSVDKYCCVLKHPFNPNLKRGSTPVDKYKDYILENTPGLSTKVQQAVKTVQNMIDKRWPGLKIKRG